MRFMATAIPVKSAKIPTILTILAGIGILVW